MRPIRGFSSCRPIKVLEAGRDTSLPLHPAHYHTHLGGRQIASFIGRVERFEEDFVSLCREFGIENAGSQTVNQSRDPSATDALGYKYGPQLQPQTIARIEALFAGDFDLLGYERLSGRRETGPS